MNNYVISEPPQYHFGLKSYSNADKCIVDGYCVFITPQNHHNMENAFVIETGKSFIAVICNQHSTNKSCTIPLIEGGFAHYRFTNESKNENIIIPHGTSLWKIMCHDYISFDARNLPCVKKECKSYH